MISAVAADALWQDILKRVEERLQERRRKLDADPKSLMWRTEEQDVMDRLADEQARLAEFKGMALWVQQGRCGTALARERENCRERIRHLKEVLAAYDGDRPK